MAKSKTQFIEDLGVEMELLGRSPMEARVLAFLLVSNPPERAFDEIVELLQASKSAISNALKTLQSQHAVKYITRVGDRKRYFLIDTENWSVKLHEDVSHFGKFNAFLNDVLNFRKSMDSENFNKGIKDILDFQNFISSKLEEALVEWDNR